MKNLKKQWIYNAYRYFLYSSGFHSVTASAIKLINFRRQSRLEEHSIGHFLFRFHEEETLRAWKFTKNKLKLRELTPFGVQTTRNLSLT